jgi:hypothetical protein
LSDRTRGRIPFDLGWEYFGSANNLTASFGYQMPPGQQTTPAGKKWLSDQITRWKSQFIVAASPWHWHLFSSWFGSQANSGKTTNIRDLALRYDGSVNSFKWPSLNREEEPYLTTR